MQKLRWMLLLAVMGAAIPTPTNAQLRHIDIFDRNGDSCVEMPIQATPTELFVVATYDAHQGLRGAELRIVGMPVDWQVTVTPNASATSVSGNVLGAGAHIRFANCDPGTDLRVTLFVITVIPTTTGTVALDLATPESPLATDCAKQLLCPAEAATCMSPFWPLAVINGQGGCAVAVEKTPWSTLKQLFR